MIPWAAVVTLLSPTGHTHSPKVGHTNDPDSGHPVRVIGLLSWYDEHPSWLVECVASAAKLCDHIIAVDGAYATFPGALRRPYSSTDQADAIMRTAAGVGIGCTVHASRQPWFGGEVEKRDFMFRLGEAFTTPEDWYLRIDADEIITCAPSDSKQRLAESEFDVAEVSIWERPSERADDLADFSGGNGVPFRCLFRALPGITIQQAHYLVMVPTDGMPRILVGDGVIHKHEDAEQLLDIGLEHRTTHRPVGRKRLKDEYYSLVRNLELECPVAFR